MIDWCRKVSLGFDRFLFASCDPVMCSVLRIAVGLLACIYALAWLPDAALWFSNEGVLQSKTAAILHNGQYKSLYFLLPQTSEVAFAGVLLLLIQSVLLLLGVFSRFQAACIFVLLTSLQHRNVLIVDGQDSVMRWLIFFLIFMPVDHAWESMATDPRRSSIHGNARQRMGIEAGADRVDSDLLFDCGH